MNLVQRIRLRREFNEWNEAQRRAREKYAAHPTVAIEEDWCPDCCYPRKQRRCQTCRDHTAMRTLRARRRGVS